MQRVFFVYRGLFHCPQLKYFCRSENEHLYCMKWGVLFSFLGLIWLASCFSSEAEVLHVKDLDENMLDLRIYHENLGESLAEKNKDYAVWLSHDMDSILELMSNRFSEHRKLKEPFREDFKKRLKPFMKKIISSVDKEDWPAAIKAYKTLTRKCNGCHIDLDIDKEVLDWSE